MKLISFRTPKPRQFNYKPMYYNPEQEEADKLRASREELENETDLSKRIALQYERNRTFKEEKARVYKQNTRNVLVAIFLIIMILYFIFMY